MSDDNDPASVDRAKQGEMELLRSETRLDSQRLDELLDPEFMEIGASGRIWSKQSTIDELTNAGPLDVTVSDLVARLVADNVVLLTYALMANGRQTLRSSWWREADGRTRCFFHQGTPAP